MRRYRLSIALVIFLFLVGMVPTFLTSPAHEEQFDDVYGNEPGRNIPILNTNRMMSSAPLEGPATGYIDPVDIKHSRTEESETVRAGTYSGTNNQMNVTLNEEDGWFASQTEVEVTDVQNLYALNGTFDDGVDPWVSSMYNPNSQVGSAVYNSTYQLVKVSNTGEYDATPRPNYVHYQDTYVYWTQTITNSPLATNFSLTYDFLYASGPMDGSVQDIWNDANLVVYIDSTIAVNPIQLYREVSERNNWYSVSESIYIPSAPASFVLKIGLFYDDTAGYEIGEDYDNDGQADDLEDLQKVEVWLDNIEFKGIDSPDFEQIDMRFHAGVLEAPITETLSVGSATITNPSLWTTDPLQIEITANTSVIFNYKVTTLMHQYMDSSWGPDPLKPGVKYSVMQGESAELTFYTYVPVSFLNLNMTIDIEHPPDWANVTVFDSLLTDVSSSCDLSSGLISIPSSFMDRVGWWEIRLESPNYAKDITVQTLDSVSDMWNDEMIFRTTNSTRVAVDIGTPTDTPDPLSLVNVTWYLPNGTIWAEDTNSGGLSGSLNSTPYVLGSSNTSAGIWTACASWTNGTEIAFDCAIFEVHHSTVLTPHVTSIDTESGQIITNFVYFVDAENGEYLMDPTASVSANWSMSSIVFGPDLLYNRWTGTFDTSEIGPGENIVVVTANLEFYDEATCSFTIHSTFSNNEVVIDNPPSEIGLGDSFLVTFQYLDQYGAGISDADIGVSFTGTENGLSWTTPVNIANGNYSIEFTAEHWGSYAISISASKELYEISEDTVFILVGEISTDLFLENGTAAVIRFGEQYRLVVRFVNGTGYGLDSATVNVESMTPATGLDVSTTIPLGNGYFSISLTPMDTSTFTILLNASLQDHQTKFDSFTITATSIQSQLTSQQSSEVVTTDQVCIVTLNLTSDLYGPLDGATIVPHNPPVGLSFNSTVPLGGGLYSIAINPLTHGSYQIVFIASADNHNEASTSVSLEVILTPTNVRVADGISSASADFSTQYDLVVFYERTLSPSNITGATITVNFTSVESLEWVIIPLVEGYIIRVNADQVGRWEFTVTASKTEHQSDSLQFILFTNEIGTDLTGFSPSESLSFGATYTYTFHYYLQNNQSSGIPGATVIPTGSGYDWISVVNLGNGYYNISVETQGLGRRVVDISFQKTGYQERSVSLDFTVIPTMVVIDTLSVRWNQFEAIELTLILSQSGINTLVSNATVSYVLYYNSVEEVSGLLEEVSDGQYSALVSATWKANDGYEIRVYVEKENHALSGGYHTIDVVQIPDPDQAVSQFLQVVIPQIGIILAIGAVAGIGQVMYSRKKKTQRALDLENKTRFNDARNILGIIVLHKGSGIPIYSKIWKSGFEEGMLSAFITAIMHFRSEFDTVDDNDEYRMLPISDIIRAIPTPNLICAFFTLTSASVEQEEKMLGFAHAVGMTLDSDLAEKPTRVVGPKTAKTLEWFFDDFVDGGLLRKYQIGEKPLSKRFKLLEELLPEATSNDTFYLDRMSRVLEKAGLSEAEAHRTILEAIEKEYILPLYSFNDVSDSEIEES